MSDERLTEIAERITAADIISFARARGFKVMIAPGPPPMPFLRGDPTNCTDALKDALIAFREEIIELLKDDPECASALSTAAPKK